MSPRFMQTYSRKAWEAGVQEAHLTLSRLGLWECGGAGESVSRPSRPGQLGAHLSW